ncbi:unnamed protein product [Aphanomyces euteiches]|uniref:Peptidase M13 C-terminal domain-containing protein n=1 Tax=Aphanomyces euteiches TaxID=100861 RepID=A0A6G0WT20_9STRA|nr:hypothetical protein Ae201684_011999 [Aphanomyces euteiches]KAH9056062.1 hypothetical protein Ae201684P_021801 [Aphanomyces euteiches]
MSTQESTSLLPQANSPTERPAWIKYAAIAGVVVVGGVVVVAAWPSAKSVASAVTGQEPLAGHNATPANETKYPAKYANFYKDMFAKMDLTTDPCDDFYQYACGGWLAATELPDTESNLDTSFQVVNKNNDKIMHDILASHPPVIDPFYQSCLSEPNVNDKAIADVTAQLNHIANLSTLDEVVAYAGFLRVNASVNAFFDVSASVDAKNSSVAVLEISQGGLTMPSVEYYANTTKYSAVFEEYIAALSLSIDVFHGVSAATILDFESQLANISLPESQLRDPWATYHKSNISSVVAAYPHVAKYLRGVNSAWLNKPSLTVMVPTPEFFPAQANLLSKTDLKLVKAYLSFQLVNARSPFLGETLRLANHKFQSVLQGLPEKESREVFCLSFVKTLLGEYLGQLYMEKAFSPTMKTQARVLIKQIESAMVDLVNTVDWLRAPTRRVALEKVANMANFVGGPDSFEHIAYNMSSTSFYANIQALNRWTVEKSFGSIGKPVDVTKWDMFAYTADAYNDPSANKMVFPAAFLQKPVYGAADYPAVVNYARIGVVMGHELTHGFDDEGRNFDPHGQLADWWSPQVKETFVHNAKCMADQYSTFPVYGLDGKTLLGHVNGQLTLGENIADNGGLKLSYNAYQQAKKADPSIADIGYDDAKLYFTAFVQGWWCKKATDNYAINWINTNPHSPTQWRARGPLMNSKVFADAFQCPAGSPMNPTKKCVVW